MNGSGFDSRQVTRDFSALKNDQTGSGWDLVPYQFVQGVISTEPQKNRSLKLVTAALRSEWKYIFICVSNM